MNYEALCKYVFSEEIVDWELHKFKSKKRQLVMARYMSIYLGNWFFPKMNGTELVKIFGLSRPCGVHAMQLIRDLSLNDKDIRKKLDKYLIVIRRQLDRENELLSLPLDSLQDKFIASIEIMEPVVRFYCDLTNSQIVKRRDIT